MDVGKLEFISGRIRGIDRCFSRTVVIRPNRSKFRFQAPAHESAPGEEIERTEHGGRAAIAACDRHKAGAYQGPHWRKREMRRSSLFASRSSHSQSLRVFQPRVRSFKRFAMSRSLLRLSLFVQYFLFEFGRFNPAAHSWLCQKQPWMKIAFRRELKTRSGQPGKSRE